MTESVDHVQRIEYDKWLESYRPLEDSDNGLRRISCRSPEAEKIIKEQPNNIWTVLDCDGEEIIVSGLAYVNRMNYVITEVPFKADAMIEVFDPDMPEYDEDGFIIS